MYGFKRTKRTICLRSMKGLPKSVEHNGDDFNTVQFESIAVNNTANATSEIIICKVAEGQKNSLTCCGCMHHTGLLLTKNTRQISPPATK